jgi:DNA-binding LytR/AlgR family response regulator
MEQKGNKVDVNLFLNTEYREICLNPNSSVLIVNNEVYVLTRMENGTKLIDMLTNMEQTKGIYSNEEVPLPPPAEQKEDPCYISFWEGNKEIKVPEDDIIYIGAFRNYTICHTFDNKEYVSRMRLNCLMEMLPARHFYRAHHSHIVNRKHIIKVIEGVRTAMAMMSYNHTLEISERNKAGFMAWFCQK